MLKPWRARALASAGVYAILVAAGWCARGLAADPHESWSFTLGGHVANIVIFGLLVAAFTSNSHLAYTNAFAGLDPAQRSAAVDASFRGPVPVDAPVRDAAIRVAGRRLYSTRSWRVVLGLLVFAAGVGLALGTWPSGWDPDGWINFAVILGISVAGTYGSLSAKHRLQTLRQATST
jgi:hypothetical protein